MAKTIQKHLPLFKILAESSDAQRSAILKTLNPAQLRAVLEAIYNVLRGTCTISDKLKKKLYQHRRVIRRLVSKDLTRQQQQRLINKHRTLLPLLLKPVIEFLSLG
ncbi:MAG: hypothetical protein AB2693_12760 [Candidatus Thiodiazotropha sp.]